MNKTIHIEKTNGEEIENENKGFPDDLFRHEPISAEIPFTTDIDKYHESMLKAALYIDEQLNKTLHSIEKSGRKFFTSKTNYVNIFDAKENDQGFCGQIRIILYSENNE